MWEGLTQTKPNEIGWAVYNNADEGYVSDPTSTDMICHIKAQNAPSHATIAAGEQMEIHWDHFPHAGPVLTYMANCNGPCETVDKTKLEFFKIDASGLLDWQTSPGDWATTVLLENNYTWTVNIPSDIAAGNYVLRHEAIGLHITGQAQYYPNCMNLAVTGGGGNNPAGVVGNALYKATDPGITVNIYNKLTSYPIPGPPLYAGAKAAVQSPTPATGPLAAAAPTGSPTTGTQDPPPVNSTVDGAVGGAGSGNVTAAAAGVGAGNSTEAGTGPAAEYEVGTGAGAGAGAGNSTEVGGTGTGAGNSTEVGGTGAGPAASPSLSSAPSQSRGPHGAQKSRGAGHWECKH